MAGGRFEYVMGNMYDSEGKINLKVSSSGFDQNILNNLSSKYIDKYEYGTSFNDTDRKILGDATAETKDWNDDYNAFVISSGPWFLRSGHADIESSAGLWYYGSGNGVADSRDSARASVFGQ